MSATIVSWFPNQSALASFSLLSSPFFFPARSSKSLYLYPESTSVATDDRIESIVSKMTATNKIGNTGAEKGRASFAPACAWVIGPFHNRRHAHEWLGPLDN
jgi:hypothetical protein